MSLSDPQKNEVEIALSCVAALRDYARRLVDSADPGRGAVGEEADVFLQKINEIFVETRAWVEQHRASSRHPEAWRLLMQAIEEISTNMESLRLLQPNTMVQVALCFDELAYALEHYAEMHREAGRSISGPNGAGL